MELRTTSISSEELFIERVRQKMCSLVEERSRGFLSEMCMTHLSTPGKFFRSRALFRLGSFYGVDPEKLLALASSCELLHEASLVHDDYQDGDKYRRGSKTVWNRFGGEQAINVGDFFLMLSVLPLSNLGSLELVENHACTSMYLVQGQSEEFELNKLTENTGNYLKKYFNCIELKTGSLFSYIAQGVACLSDLSKDQQKFLSDVYSEMGVIFQLQDDLLDLFCDKKREIQGTDIQEGKVSLLVAILLDQEETSATQLLKSILLKSRTATVERDIEIAKEIFLEKGSLKQGVLLLKNKVQELMSKMDQFENHDLKSHIQRNLSDLLKPIDCIL